MMDTALHFLSWGVRIVIAAGCFGLMSLKSMPRIMANSRDAVHFWRFRKQAENDLQKVRRWTVLCTSSTVKPLYCEHLGDLVKCPV